ncbi:hypothetical protein [Vibrio sp. TRT 29B02]|uniref:hypothetical protein n=1 Tax=Vibrio sp. TRT 29B02 TaxID=3418508 RepID=UPI003CEBFC57
MTLNRNKVLRFLSKKLKFFLKKAYVFALKTCIRGPINPYIKESVESLGLNENRSVDYEGTLPLELNKWLKFLPEKKSYVAIDFGSGKGLAVKTLNNNNKIDKVYGVEISKKLYEQSKIFLSSEVNDETVELIHSDAVSLTPDILRNVNLFYFYNPFPELVFKEVMKVIHNSIEERKRDFYIIYFNPVYDELIYDFFPNINSFELDNFFSNAKTRIYYERKI